MGTTATQNLPYPELPDSADVPADVQALAEMLDTLLQGLEVSQPPVGGIASYGGTTDPSASWLICDGRSLVRATYPALFTALAVAYGSVDGTHFNIPDLRGRVPVGVDGAAARLTASDAIGNGAGAEKHTLSTGEMPSHAHGSGSAWEFMMWRPGDAANWPGGAGLPYPEVHQANVANAGGGGAHNNMQPYQVVNYIIRVL